MMVPSDASRAEEVRGHDADLLRLRLLAASPPPAPALLAIPPVPPALGPVQSPARRCVHGHPSGFVSPLSLPPRIGPRGPPQWPLPPLSSSYTSHFPPSLPPLPPPPPLPSTIAPHLPLPNAGGSPLPHVPGLPPQATSSRRSPPQLPPRPTLPTWAQHDRPPQDEPKHRQPPRFAVGGAPMVRSPPSLRPSEPGAASFLHPGGWVNEVDSRVCPAFLARPHPNVAQRLRYQNENIRRAWERECAQLYESRRRADEIHREERALMDAERHAWQVERNLMVDRMMSLQSEVNRLSLEPWVPRSQATLQSDLLRAPAAVDVNTIHPDLEGIPIRAHAVGRPTFVDGPPPPLDFSSGGSSQGAAQDYTTARSCLGATAPTKGDALEVLSPEEETRLTMHAGHTPRPSTVVAPAVSRIMAEAAVSASGGATPTAGAPPAEHQRGAAGPSEVLATNAAIAATAAAAAAAAAAAMAIVYPPPDLDDTSPAPSDDPQLKAPLMVRNMPIHDAIFFRTLSEKLEDVVSTQDEPSVLRSPVIPRSPDPQATTEAETGSAVDATTSAMMDGAADASEAPSAEGPVARILHQNSGEADDDGTDDDKEPEIPLRLKQSNNFGAPFGSVHPRPRPFS